MDKKSRDPHPQHQQQQKYGEQQLITTISLLLVSNLAYLFHPEIYSSFIFHVEFTYLKGGSSKQIEF